MKRTFAYGLLLLAVMLIVGCQGVTTQSPTTAAPTTVAPTSAPTTEAPTTAPTTEAPTTAPTTVAPTTNSVSTEPITTEPISTEPTVTEPVDPNLIANSDFESGEATGYRAMGSDTIAVSADQAHSGDYSLFINNRTESWQGFEYDVTGIELDKEYVYAANVYTTNEAGVDFILMLSPWGKSTNDNYIWVYFGSPWGHVEPNTWTQVTLSFRLSLVGGSLYLFDSEDNPYLVKDQNGTDDLYQSLDLVRLSFQAAAGVDLYMDDIVVREAE
ncbi:MAG: carbohydrate binding domain-containing protein [Candidatus Izemoplasmatales bacterium]|nr:carbohydrate binding domain-containing protein [Candidatus Izemoplasmatales bacterium]